MTVGERLIEAYKESLGTEDKKIIAKYLGFETDKAVYKVINGERELNFDALIKFRNSTKRSIDWLLTGEGPDITSAVESEQEARIDLDESETIFIQGLAEVEGKGFDEVVRELVIEALRQRSSTLFTDYRQLDPDQLESLLKQLLKVNHNGGGRKTA